MHVSHAHTATAVDFSRGTRNFTQIIIIVIVVVVIIIIIIIIIIEIVLKAHKLIHT